jgi:hypothetical protein
MLLAVAVLAYGVLYDRPPRPWAVSEVPVAFWAWQEHSPSESDVTAAVADAGATALFLHAGQLDLESGKVHRIRAIQGPFPRGIAIHLVYNATRSLLPEFEHVDETELADAIRRAHEEDTRRASSDQATVAGLQLDIDVPTRLLGRYARVLQAVRRQLPGDQKLSITGLPTWMDSPTIERPLDEVDFWIPQCYGAKIPERIDTAIPISSPQAVSRAIDRARHLGRPFCAGLADYGYVLHYSTTGSLLTLRGDIDPAGVASRSDFELADRGPFDGPLGGAASEGSVASEWRYVYRARREAVVDETVVKTGESLVLDVPSAACLSAAAKAVRERAGKSLLGICVFRLAAAGDPAILTMREVSAALAGKAPTFEVRARATVESQNRGGRRYLRLELSNPGSARPVMGPDAFALDLAVPPGIFGTVDLAGFASMEPLCSTPGQGPARPCGAARANLLRLTAVAFKPGAAARADFELTAGPPSEIPARISMMGDGDQSFTRDLTISVEAKSTP